MDGILNINKPSGMTSFSVVSQVKHITHEKHTGHAGTLDPLATGVLPVCLGQATRIIEFLFDETKHYRAEVELGVTTDTYDSTGKVIRTGDPSEISRDKIEEALVRFRGTIQQTPPMYSAIKHKGQPLYKLARSGIEIERQSRCAQVHVLEIVDWQPPIVTLDVVCGKGTYIRSLAHDLGESLGCGASMKSLVRLRVGPFSIENALTLPDLAEAFRNGYGEKYLYPADHALLNFDALVVNHEQQCSLIHGTALALPSSHHPGLVSGSRSRAYTEDGRFVGMLKYDAENGRWQPEKIFLKNCCGEQT